MALGLGGACPGGFSRSADAALLRALRFVRDYGMVLVEGVPAPGAANLSSPAPGATSMADGEAASEALWRRVGSGRLQGSVYSAGAWRTEVLPPGDPSNTDSAYGLRALPSHTDGNYMEARPGLQAFHCLRADPAGGDTVLVDGFAVAERLRAADPAAFAVLCAYELPYHHTGADGLQMQWKRVFELDDAGGVAGFGFNDADRAPLTLRQYAGLRAVAVALASGPSPSPAAAALSLPSAVVVPEIYRSLRALAACLRDPAAEVTLALRPGTALVFDNRRVTHARTALGRTSGVGRVLAGGYIATEDWHSALRLVSRAAGAYEPA